MFNKNFATLFVVTIIVAFAWYTNQAESQFVEKGLVSYWSFDEIKQQTVKDDFGDNDGTVNGDPEIVKGMYGSALKFDGVDDYVDLGYQVGPDLDGASEITTEAWVNWNSMPPNDTVSYIFGTRIEGGYAGVDFLLRNTGGTCYLRVAGRSEVADSYQQANYAFSTTHVWKHIVDILDFANGKLYIYLDGVQVKEEDATFGAATYTRGKNESQEDTIGAGPRKDGFLDGIIDELRIYNRALSEAEVLRNYQGLSVVNLAGKLSLTWGEIKASR